MRARKIPQFAGLLALAGLRGAPALAAPWDHILSKCAELLEKPYQQLVESNTNESLLLTTEQFKTATGRPLLFSLGLGKSLGAGFFGQVAVVTHISDPELEALVRGVGEHAFSGLLAVKIPHTLRRINFGMSFPFTNAENVREAESYQRLVSKVPKIEASPLFPKSPAWRKGTLPVAPILAAVPTSRGMLIFKPLLRGKGLSQIAEIYKANGNRLPPEMIEGLRNHYQMVQATYGAAAFSTDIRPPNLLWIGVETAEERAQLKFLGMSKPGFIAFEMAMVPNNFPVFIEGKGLSFEQYLAQYEEYLQGTLHK